MNISIIRKFLTNTTTIGNFTINTFTCFSLEDRLREAGIKVQDETAIPNGQYKVIVDYSNRFKRYMPHILDVPLFSGIRIHSGNTSADTDGCILLGLQKSNNTIIKSKLAYTSFFKLFAVEDGFDKVNNCQIFKAREETFINITTEILSDERTPENA